MGLCVGGERLVWHGPGWPSPSTLQILKQPSEPRSVKPALLLLALAVAALAAVAAGTAPAHAQSMGTILYLQPLPSGVEEGESVELYGWLSDIDGHAVPDATIHVKGDTGPASGETISILTTDTDGLFLDYWTAERRPAGGSWAFYAVFEGKDNLLGSRSETHAVEVAEAASVPQPQQPSAPDAYDSGCLIATAAHGTELAPQVQALREYRDGTLLATGSGSAFMSAFSAAYYSFSPHVADLGREYPAFRQAVAAMIAPMLHALHVAALADPGSEASVALHGIAALLIVAGLYVGAPAAGAAVAARALRGRRRSRCGGPLPA